MCIIHDILLTMNHYWNIYMFIIGHHFFNNPIWTITETMKLPLKLTEIYIIPVFKLMHTYCPFHILKTLLTHLSDYFNIEILLFLASEFLKYTEITV